MQGMLELEVERDATLQWLLTEGRTPFRQVTELLGSKHKLSIMWELARSPRRFKELERLLAPVTPKVLTRNLRDLEASSLITRLSLDVSPPHVTYQLSPIGEALRPHIKALCRWAYENAEALTPKTDRMPAP